MSEIKPRDFPPDPPYEEPKPGNWPPELMVVGNQIQTRNGKPVWLQGLNVISLEWTTTGEGVLTTMLEAIHVWKAKIIRFAMKDDFWFGRGPDQTDGGAAYRALIDAAVNLAANRGVYLLLDLHRFYAPKQEHVEFWKDAAVRYKNHPAVLFDLFNEPHTISWKVWRDGGFVEEKKKPGDEDSFLTGEDKKQAAGGFESPGMQGLVDAVRGTGANNIILAGGLDWAYDCSGFVDGYALDDRGGNGIVISTHIYNWKTDWKGKVLCVVDKYPVLVGEVGADTKKMPFLPLEIQEDPYTWVPDMLGLIQKYKLHWTGWSFHPWATPILISDWKYTPTPFWGEFAKRALHGEGFELKRLR